MEGSTGDPRLSFLGCYVQKSMKLKQEKWARLLGVEEHRKQIIEFLDNPEPPLLIVMQVSNTVYFALISLLSYEWYNTIFDSTQYYIRCSFASIRRRLLDFLE